MLHKLLLVLFHSSIPKILGNTTIHKHDLLPAQYTGSHMKVETVAGMLTNLPCNITPSIPGDRVLLVLWYKDGLGKPIYTFDLRANSRSTDILLSKESNGRAYLNLKSKPMASLSLHGVEEGDKGEYSCRVDFKLSPTRYQAITLNVLVPPHKILIFDRKGKDIRAILGPMKIGQHAQITCDVLGGTPESRVFWFSGSSLLDASYKEISDGQSRNTLQLNITRDMHNAEIECRGSNNNRTDTLSKKLLITVLLPVEYVRISSSPPELSAGEEYQLDCVAGGSNPSPSMSWRFSDSNQILTGASQMEMAGGSRTVSRLTFVPQEEDEGKSVVCSALNEALNSSLETSIRLRVSSVPKIRLDYGTSIQAGSIKEGDDIYLTCHISATPLTYKESWYFQGEVIQLGTTGVSFHENSLVIRNISKSHQGSFSCSGTNTEGTGYSNTVQLAVIYSPICDKLRQSISLKRGEGRMVSCPVSSNPIPSSYRWQLRAGGGVQNLAESSREIHLRPASDADYGSLFCWGENTVGEQLKPCIININPTGVPDPVVECRTNVSLSSMTVSCVPGAEGGETQHFVLKLNFSTQSKFNRMELVSSQTPFFVVKELPPGARVLGNVVAVNSNGESVPFDLILHVPPTHDLHRLARDEAETRDITWILLGIGSVLCLLTLTIGIVIRVILLHIQRERIKATSVDVNQLVDLPVNSRRSYDGGVFNHWCYQPPVLHSQPTPILQHQGMRYISPFYTLPRGGGGYHHATRWGDSLPQRGPHHAATWGGYRRECGVRHHSSTEHNLSGVFFVEEPLFGSMDQRSVRSLDVAL